MPSDLTSAGAATRARAAWDRELDRLVAVELAAFLRGVRLDAMDDPDSLRAAATLGTVLNRWGRLVDKVVDRLLDWVPDPLYLGAARRRLETSDLPDQAYTSATAVLTQASEQRWSPASTRRAMAVALSPLTPAVAGPELSRVANQVGWAARAARIARTEATAAFGRSMLMAVYDDPDLTAKRWVAHHDKITRPTHARADGQTVPLDASFIVGGYALLVPGDPTAPVAETASCRCVIIGARRSTLLT